MTPATKLAGRTVVASVSGGKDSAAMSLYLRELGIEHRRVFMDTGWEAACTYDYLRGELTRVLGSIEEISGPLLMEDLIRHKGMFPSRLRRFCTQQLKVLPMKRYLGMLMDAGEDVVNAVGIRRAESKARSEMPEWEWQEGFDCEVWRPIIHWSEQDVIDIHRRHGLRPNPLYLMGQTRVGCFPCIFARKAEIRFIADRYPEQIARIRALEAEVGVAAARRAEQAGTTLKWLPTWFQSPLRTEPCPACAGKPGNAACGGCHGTGRLSAGACWPIDDIVEWAHTTRGGKQRELFAATEGDQGCVRWGLCETQTEE